MPVSAFDGVVPVVDRTSFVHETASLIGDVIIGPGCYVGPFASLRGDFGRILVGEGSNVQDSCVIHAFPGADAVLEPNSHVGHGAILHGCRIGAFALIGIGSTVLDGAEIGADALLGEARTPRRGRRHRLAPPTDPAVAVAAGRGSAPSVGAARVRHCERATERLGMRPRGWSRFEPPEHARRLSDAEHALCFLAGANSVFAGDRLLTTPNVDEGSDDALLARLGLVRETTAPEPVPAPAP